MGNIKHIPDNKEMSEDTGRQENFILDAVEAAFHGVVAEKAQPSKEPHMRVQILRGEREVPDITFSWVPKDNVYRSIHAFVTEHTNHFDLAVDVNAWSDECKSNSRVCYRKWQHAEVAHMRIPPDRSPDFDRLRKTLSRAYSLVSRWSRPDLVRRSQLPLDH